MIKLYAAFNRRTKEYYQGKGYWNIKIKLFIPEILKRSLNLFKNRKSYLNINLDEITIEEYEITTPSSIVDSNIFTSKKKK